MNHKRVQLTELFYDLVFVYAISQMTELIKELHHGFLPIGHVFAYVLALVVLVNTWMIQTVFTNRYGTNSLVNIFFMLANMASVLYVANTFTAEVSLETFLPFASGVGLSSLILLLQYIIQYFHAKNAADKKVIRRFIGIFSFRVAMITVSLILPFKVMGIGFWVFMIGIFGSTVMPMFMTGVMRQVPVNFPHLLERISLFTILMFGEMILAVVPYFKPGQFHLTSLLLFLTVAALFVFYICEIDHAIEDKVPYYSGHALIYWHYPIFLAISMITVALGFLGSHYKENPLFIIHFIYLAVGLFYLSVLALKRYNKPSHRLTPFFLVFTGSIYSLSYLASLVLHHQYWFVSLIICTMANVLAVGFIVFNVKRMPETLRYIFWGY